jgi:hypothetical protein
MSADSSAIEKAMEGQDSVGTEPVMGQPMEGESPLRTIAGLFGVNLTASGTWQYAYSPSRSEDVERPSSAPPSMGMVAQGVSMQNYGNT